MKNKTLFYSKFIYRMSEGGPKPQEVKREKPEDKMKNATQKAIDLIDKVGNGLVNLTVKDKKALASHKQSIKALNAGFAREAKGKSPKAVKALFNKYKERVKSVVNKVKQIAEVKMLDKDLKIIIDEQYSVANAKMMKLYDNLSDFVKKYTAKKHVQMLVDAYLVRWQNNAKNKITKLSNNLETISTDLISLKAVKRSLNGNTGELATTLSNYKQAIKDNLNIWKNPDKDEWRRVYSDPNWDTKYEKKARTYTAKQVQKLINQGATPSIGAGYEKLYNKVLAEYKQKNPPPLPNGDVKYANRIKAQAQKAALSAIGADDLAEIENNPTRRKKYWSIYHRIKRQLKDKNPPLKAESVA